MARFHRFLSFVPFFFGLCVVLLALGGCQGTTASSRPVWSRADASTPSAAVAQMPQTGATMATAQTPPAALTTKVAILLPLSGPQAGLGQSLLQAAQLAVFDSGLDNFELLPLDTAGTRQGAQQAAAMAVQSGVQIILGPLFADEVSGAQAALIGQSINMIAFSTDWTLAGGHTFLMGFLPFGQVERIASYAASRGLKNTTILAGTDAYGKATAQSFLSIAPRLGITANQSSLLTQPADSVFIPSSGSDLTSALARTAAMPHLRKLGTGLWDDARLAAMPSMNGAWFAAPSPRGRTGFEQRYQATYGSAPVRISTLAYDATALVTTLAKIAYSQGVVPNYDTTILTSPSGFAGLDGILRFQQNGLAERGLSVLEIRGGTIVEIDPAPRQF